ncbi:MAG: outer membrane protein assembly factor BamA [Deltaproteobacteria bacterium]|nr:outer membrane protein assembly factor BamA [Deltaproteobacteria bacterium]
MTVTFSSARPAQAEYYMEALVGEKIARIHFVGPEEISPSTYKSLITLKEGARFSTRELDSAIRALYNSGKFQNVIVHTEKGKEGIALIFYLKPNAFVRRIDFEGNRVFDDDELASQISMREGDIFNPQLHSAVISQIQKFYEEEGYLNVKVSTRYDAVETLYQQNVTFQISEGSLCRFSAIQIELPEGKEEREEEIKELYNRLDLEAGDRFTQRDLQERIRGLKIHLARNHYLTATLSSPLLSFNADRSRVDLILPVKPGPQYLFYFSGNKKYSKRQLKDAITKRAEELLGAMSVDEALFAIQEYYLTRGFASLQLSHEMKVKDAIREIKVFVNEGPRALIKEIEIIGNQSLSDEEYRKFLREQPSQLIGSGYFYRADFEQAVEPLESFLQNRGFLRAKVTDLRFIPEREGKFFTVQMTVDEGVQTLIDEIQVQGNRETSTEEILLQFPIRTGIPLQFHEIELAIGKLRDWYQEQGFYYASIQQPTLPLREKSGVVRVGPDDTHASVFLMIDEGPRVTIGDIYIRGNESTRDIVIRRELTLRTGDFVKPSQLRHDESKLARLGLFSQVMIAPLEQEVRKAVQHIVVQVKELDHGVFEFGGGYSIDDGMRGFAGIAHRNLWGMNRTASLYGKMSRRFNRKEVPGSKELFIEGAATAGYVEPHFFQQNLTWRTNLQYAKEGTIPFDKESYTGSTSLERSIGRINLIGKYQLEWRSIFRTLQDERQLGQRLISAILPTLQLDHRDNTFYPTHGSFHSITTEYASPALGSDAAIHYLKIFGNTNWYFTFIDPLILAFSLRGGYGKSLHETSSIPVDKRFYLGGKGTIRGFKENSLGVESDSQEVRLTTFLNYKTELRFPIYGDFTGALFQDGGGVFFSGDFKGALRNSAGVSLQYKTPVGPVSLDLAFLLDKKPEEKILRLHFAIGTF